MLDDEEKRYLIWVTAKAYEGWGAVLDLGPWLGGSSVALAEGLRRSDKPGKVGSRDLFEWDAGYMNASLRCDLQPGDDFQPLFRQQTAAYADRIEDERMDLLQGSWSGGPIEILFVDAAKSWQLWRSILQIFGPSLEPERSRVIHQDFRHPTCPWLPLTCDSRPDVWRQVEAVEHGTTVTFTPRRRLVAGEAGDLCREDLDYAEKKRVFLARVADDYPAHAWRYQLPLYVEAVRVGDEALARSLLDAVEGARASDPQADKLVPLVIDQDRLERGWSFCASGRFEEALALAMKIRPGGRFHYEGLVLAGQAARSLEDLARAEEALAAARQLDPRRAEAILETAWLRLAQGRPSEGEAMVEQTLKGGTKLPPLLLAALYRVLTHLVGHQGRLAESLQHNDRFLSLAPDNGDGLVDRVRILEALGRRTEASSVLATLVRLHPGHPAAQELQGRLAAR